MQKQKEKNIVLFIIHNFEKTAIFELKFFPFSCYSAIKYSDNVIDLLSYDSLRFTDHMSMHFSYDLALGFPFQRN